MLYKQIGKIEMEDKNMVKVIRVYGECLGALTKWEAFLKMRYPLRVLEEYQVDRLEV